MRRYSLPQLEAFLWICRLGTFRAAADHLHVTQPTISLRLAELEAALGISLFDKSGRGVVLTEQGARVLRFVEQGIGLLDHMDEMIGAEEPFEGVLRLGAIDTLAMTCLLQVVGMLETLYPRLRVELTVTSSSKLAQLLDQKKLDIAFLGQPPADENCWFELVGSLPTAWIGERSKFAPGQIATAQGICRERILALPPPSRLRQIIEGWFANEKLPVPALSLCNDLSVITRFVVKGWAISVLPVCLVRQEVQEGLVSICTPTVPLAALPLYVAGQPATRSAKVTQVVGQLSDLISASGIFSGTPT
jgi:DNA-binding transcriptional LysR family regulator